MQVIAIPTPMSKTILPTIIPIITPIDNAATSGVGMGMGSEKLQTCVLFAAETHVKVVESSLKIEQQVSGQFEHSETVFLSGNGAHVS